jgi:hypothetical protein
MNVRLSCQPSHYIIIELSWAATPPPSAAFSGMVRDLKHDIATLSLAMSEHAQRLDRIDTRLGSERPQSIEPAGRQLLTGCALQKAPQIPC